MKCRRRLQWNFALPVFAVLATLLDCEFALAQPSADSRNAATWYARAISSWQQFRQNSPQQADLIANFSPDGSTPITPELRAALIQVQGIIGDFRKGSQQERCDFALDYSQGFELLLPHLSEMRGIARAMKADVVVRIADGDTSGAAAELASMYRSSGHFGDDHVLISSLVGQAVFNLADGAVQMGLDTAAFNAADAAALLSAAQQLGTQDPFAYVDSMGMEQEIALATFEKYRGPEGIKALAGLLGDGERLDQLAEYSDEDFDKALGQYDQMMTTVSGIFANTDAEAARAELAELEKAIEAGEYGQLVMVLTPAFSKILENKLKGEALLAARIKSLEALASGAQKPEEAANAAMWYLRAIELWEALPAPSRRLVVSFAAAPDRAPPAEIIAVLDDAQAAFDVFREASTKRRCDFSVFAPVRGRSPVAPHYAPGMHELQRAMIVEAARLLAAGQREHAVEALAAAMRASAHLGNDVNLACCRAAHVNFAALLDFIESALAAGAIDLRSAPQLADAAGRISRKDPFGYLDALVKTRDLLTRERLGPPVVGEAATKEWQRQIEVLRQFNGDQTFFVLIILDEFTRRSNDKGPPPDVQAWEPGAITLPQTIERLNGVIDAQAEQAIRAQYDDVMGRLNQNEWEIFVGRETPPPARLVEGLTRARADLRRATRLLMLPVEAPPTSAPDKTTP
jgi:hypothetical protein